MILELLLNNKYLAGAVAFILAGLYVWFKGYSAGKDIIKERHEKAKEELHDRIRQVEAQNQKTDRKREQDVKDINGDQSIDTLMRVWDSLNRKDTDPKP